MTPAVGPRCWLALALALPGCTLDRGRGFATLEEANLEVSLEGLGEAGENELSTDRGYAIVVERAALAITHLDLQELASAATNAEGDAHEHDEADHEHDEADHEDDEADHEDDELAAEKAFSTLVTLGFDSALSMRAYGATAADRYDPSRELARSSPERVLVVLAHLEFEGTVSGGDLADESAKLVVDLPLDTELAASFEPVEIDQDGPESLRLSSTVVVPGSLFDGIDFSALAAGGGVVIDDPEAPAALELVTALAASETHASLE